MRYIVNAAEMKEYDSNTIHRIGVPSMVLMERAAIAVRDQIRKRFPMPASVLIAVGNGNNGADGLALARLMHQEGWHVTVWQTDWRESGKQTDEYTQQEKILMHYIEHTSFLCPETEYTVIVDAIFGVGLSRPVEGVFADAICQLNSHPGYKVAVDIPSGISADTGNILGTAFRADLTVTFAFGKRGLYLYPGAEHAGEIVVADIGIDEVSFYGHLPGMYTEEKSAGELLPKRSGAGSKGTFGKVLLIAGFEQMAGAAALSARAVYRTGAGMVKVICAPENRSIIQCSVPEALYGAPVTLEEQLGWADVAAIGPGLGRSKEASGLLKKVLTGDENMPLVLDADALNIIAGEEELSRMLQERIRRRGNVVLTPHAGELARLRGSSVEDIKRDPAQALEDILEKYPCVIAAKDARTLVGQPGKAVYLNLAGNSGMATAGSGDVLTGVIAGLLAQGLEPGRAARDGVRLHALAGDAAARHRGTHGLMAGDIAEYIGRE